jgi:hypothetical protein
MTTLKTNVPAQHRVDEGRRKAEAEANEPAQKALLNDAELWERMADYEEKNPEPK